ncbi:hypothetical protein D3C73_1251530 [compost metagenome]
MHHRQQAEHHSLVACSQIIQKLLALLALLLHIVWHDSREVVVLVLPALPVCNVRLHSQQTVFYLPNRFVCWYRNDVQR